MTEANVENSKVPGQKKEVKRNKWEMKQKKKKARQPLTPLLQTYCTPVTVVLQTGCSRTAKQLQWHCKAVAVALQSSCSRTAKQIAASLQSGLQWHCKKDAATLQWTYSNLTVGSQDFKVWRY